MLMALNEPLPKQVFGHGWLNIDGGKISKSKGNTVDPKILCDRYGVDAIRYFLMREVAFGGDGNFTNEALIKRLNADLANDLGNLVSRTAAMTAKYFSGKVPAAPAKPLHEEELSSLAAATVSKVEELLDKLLFSDALSDIWILVKRLNKFADESKPWVLAGDPEKRLELAGVMRALAEGIRVVAVLIGPFMPGTSKAILDRLNLPDSEGRSWDSAKSFDSIGEFEIAKGDAIFPRIDIKAELAYLSVQSPFGAEPASEGKPKEADADKDKVKAEEAALPEGVITIDDFAKVELKVGLILACEKVGKSDKLLKSQVKLGDGTRQIVSGIAQWYSPEQMVGKRIVVVTNLKPAKLRGELSEGMLLAAADEAGNLSLVTLDREIADGSGVR
jgi:methionyl-tRNA synthetase